MKQIPESFRKNGYDFEIVKRTEKVVILRQLNALGGVVAWEVHKVRLNPAAAVQYCQPDGTYKIIKYLKSEILASNQEFGRYAWSYNTQEAAMNKYNELTGNPERFTPNDQTEEYYKQ